LAYSNFYSGPSHVCCITVLYVTSIKSLQLNSSICSAHAYVWLRLAVAVMDCTVQDYGIYVQRASNYTWVRRV